MLIHLFTSFITISGGRDREMSGTEICTGFSMDVIRFTISHNFEWFSCFSFLFTLCFSECQNYQSLTSADRKVTHGIGGKCDNGLGPGWFRFEGAAGTRIATTCPPYHRCGTDAPGWMNGGHPSVADGQVTRQVCFSWDYCCYWTINIKVRNCGSYYVYHFSGSTPKCQLRFCGSD